MAPPPTVNGKPTVYSINALNRWSCKSRELPLVLTVKSLHVYDFDNTLFSSPLPNPQLWNIPTVGYLQTYECFVNGGWWHDPSILGATGEGLAKEEPRAWANWWNEEVVKLVELSIQQKDVLTVLLTGRGETNFADLICRIAESRKLNCDMTVLKPEIGPAGQRFNTTMEFKQTFLKDLVFTYKQADEIRIYEDRPRHVKGFREYFEKLNKSLLSHPIDQPPPSRKPITSEVIHVADFSSHLDPVTECAAIQNIINNHNVVVTNKGPNPTRSPHPRMQIKKTFIYLGYLINATDSARLITLANIQPLSIIDSGEVKFMAASILIAPRPADRTLLQKIGGMGKKVTWQVTGTAVFENRIWAARVAPVPQSEKTYTNDETPIVVLALRKGARPIDANRIQKWQPVQPEKAFIFETVVGNKEFLRIEPEDSEYELERNESRYANRPPVGNNIHKRKYGEENGWRGKDNHSNGLRGGNGNGNGHAGSDRHGQARYFNQQKDDRRTFSSNRGGRGGEKNFRANQNIGGRGGRGNDRGRGGGGGGAGGSGGGGRGRGGRGGPPGYKSLDDYGPGGFDGSNDFRGAMQGSGRAEEAMEMNYCHDSLRWAMLCRIREALRSSRVGDIDKLVTAWHVSCILYGLDISGHVSFRDGQLQHLPFTVIAGLMRSVQVTNESEPREGISKYSAPTEYTIQSLHLLSICRDPGPGPDPDP